MKTIDTHRFFLATNNEGSKALPQEVDVLSWVSGVQGNASPYSGAIISILTCPEPQREGSLPVGWVTYSRLGRLRAYRLDAGLADLFGQTGSDLKVLKAYIGPTPETVVDPPKMVDQPTAFVRQPHETGGRS